MIIIDYKKQKHKEIIAACVHALKSGKVIAYPTDTSYGLAVDADNLNAVKKLYKVKGRDFKKPVHVVVPSVGYSKKIVNWDKFSAKLVKKFWPGALTLVGGCRVEGAGYRMLSAGTKTLGVRMPKNQIALDLAKNLKRPITATSANVSGGKDCYSAADIANQFKTKKDKPDIIINTGKLRKRKPSTIVKIDKNQFKILRQGPISEKQLKQALRPKG